MKSKHRAWMLTGWAAGAGVCSDSALHIYFEGDGVRAIIRLGVAALALWGAKLQFDLLKLDIRIDLSEEEGARLSRKIYLQQQLDQIEVLKNEEAE